MDNASESLVRIRISLHVSALPISFPKFITVKLFWRSKVPNFQIKLSDVPLRSGLLQAC